MYQIYMPMVEQTPNLAGVEIWPGCRFLKERLPDLGVKFVRTFVRWDLAEFVKGMYAWPNLNLDVIQASGANVIVTLKAAPQWAITNGKFDRNFLDEWRNFVEAAGRHYPTVRMWSIWNEPDADPGEVGYYGGLGGDAVLYAELLTAAYAALHGMNSENRVLGGEISGDAVWMKAVFELKAPMDGVAFHHYVWPGNYGLEEYTIREKVRELRKMMIDQQYGWLPIYWTETAMIWEGMATEEKLRQQAEWVGMADELAHELELAGWVWYSFLDPGWRHAGLLNSDGTPKPAYQAMMELNR
jgi:hypothetical protein